MICPKCGFEYDNLNKPDCPQCGQKNISLNLSSSINLQVDLCYKGKSNEKINKRPSFEFKGGNEVNHRLKVKVDRNYHIDRANDRYHEIVKDKKTGEIIYRVDEKLSDHMNHGDAKKANNIKKK